MYFLWYTQNLYTRMTIPYSCQSNTLDQVAMLSTSSVIKKKKRTKQGQQARKEIFKLSRSTELLLPKAPFERLVKQMTGEIYKNQTVLWTSNGMLALQDAAENYITQEFIRADTARSFGKRKTLSVRDLSYSNINGQLMPGQQPFV